jgi:hypothetical protein
MRNGATATYMVYVDYSVRVKVSVLGSTLYRVIPQCLKAGLIMTGTGSGEM